MVWKLSNMKFLKLFLITTTILSTNLMGQDENILLEIAKKGFEARANAGGILNREASASAFRKPFEGLEDSQKIKSIVLYLYDIDKSDSKLSMSSAILMNPVSALADDHDFIKDWSSSRSMLKHEKDPRKFFLISKMISMSKNGANQDFIAERTHMLFADGRVTKKEGEYTRSYANDVSKYAYDAIVHNLRVLDADFELPLESLSHEEKAVNLAIWLKNHWPGCQNMEIPERLKSDQKRPNRKNHGTQSSLYPTDKVSKEKTSPTTIAEQTTEKSHVFWIFGVVIFATMIFVLIRVVKTG
jgi:hypothetical protein